MSKYQRALDELFDWAIDNVKEHHDLEKTYLDEEKKSLQELVDKATPKNLLEEEIGNIIHLHCPNCKRVVTHETEGGRRYITKHNYCHKCGQALDWSES